MPDADHVWPNRFFISDERTYGAAGTRTVEQLQSLCVVDQYLMKM